MARVLRQVFKKYAKQPFQPGNKSISSGFVFTWWWKEKSVCIV